MELFWVERDLERSSHTTPELDHLAMSVSFVFSEVDIIVTG